MTIEELELKVQQLENRLELLVAIDESILETKEKRNDERFNKELQKKKFYRSDDE